MDLFFVRMPSISLWFAYANTGSMAKLPIQVPPKEHFSLDNINHTSVDYQGKAWFRKLLIERETADQLLARLRPMQTESSQGLLGIRLRRSTKMACLGSTKDSQSQLPDVPVILCSACALVEHAVNVTYCRVIG
jgi:hypothetical protein